MQKGSRHKPETIAKLRSHWKVEEEDVIQYLQELPWEAFEVFLTKHILPRVKRKK
jgi:hypothetical protein